MKKALLTIICSFAFSFYSPAQQFTVPYHSSFDNPADTVGWWHQALSGIDDWELGFPQKYYFNFTTSQPNAWVTKRTGWANRNADRVLVTPFFDLSNTNVDYVLSFYNERHTRNTNNTDWFLEYSQGSSNVWQVLNDANAAKVNWQTTMSGFISLNQGIMVYSAINLNFIQGQDSIRFRFRLKTDAVDAEGWVIDDFRISNGYVNLFATQGNPIATSRFCPTITVSSTVGYHNDLYLPYDNSTEYFLSTDTVLDALDLSLGIKTGGLYLSTSLYSHTLTLPSNLAMGNYYIFYKHDIYNTLPETDETDNVSFAPLRIDSIYSLPLIDDFETTPSLWKPHTRDGEMLVWRHGQGTNHRNAGSHSGSLSWHTSPSKDIYNAACAYGNNCHEQYLVSPYLDLSTDTAPLIFSFWIKSNGLSGILSIQYNTSCNIGWSTISNLPQPTINDWEPVNLRIPTIISSNPNVRFRIKYLTTSSNTSGIPDVNIDDVYIGPIRPDISLERDKLNRSTVASVSIDTLKYNLSNSGLATMPASTTQFYWSTDSILDANDVLLGTKQEAAIPDTTNRWETFVYTKPTSATGMYYIIYVADATNSATEMREYNNQGYFKLFQNASYTLPYLNNFETEIEGWRHHATLGTDVWQWSVAGGGNLPVGFTDSKAWIMNNNNVLPDMSRMHLYSPVFDLSAAVRPVLEFDLAIANLQGNTLMASGQMNMSYSIDGGATWQVLDTTNRSFNKWYYDFEYSDNTGHDNLGSNTNLSTRLLFDNFEKVFAGHDMYYGRNMGNVTHHILDLSFLVGQPRVQFRYNIATGESIQARGPVIDNFSLKEGFIDLTNLFHKKLMVGNGADSIRLEFQFKNLGNYISDSANVKVYLSADTVLGTGDYLLGEEFLLPIQPGLRYYFNVRFRAPLNLSAYSYVVYKIDEANTNVESDETNNGGHFPLAFEGVTQYPYLEDFNNVVVNGWKPYVLSAAGGIYKDAFRFRNTLGINEPLHNVGRKSGEMFTDDINRVMPISSVPTWYLESPVFNFEYLDNIMLTFDLMCIGSKTFYGEEGGNLQYSVNGGNTWSVLTENLGQATGWYEEEVLKDLNNEPGWTGTDGISYTIRELEPRSFDASFLAGEKNVVFRFKHHSNHQWFSPGAQGMRIDNFKVEGQSSGNDYEALDNMKAITKPYSPLVNVEYSIKNNGQGMGVPTATKFYWSADNVFDGSDTLVHTATQGAIASQATDVQTAGIALPAHLMQPTFYLFYMADANNVLAEANENDNMGSFEVTLDSLTAIAHTELDNIGVYVNEDKVYISAPVLTKPGGYSMKVLTMQGQLLYQQDLRLTPGTQVVTLPETLASGLYLISLTDGEQVRTLKTLLYR